MRASASLAGVLGRRMPGALVLLLTFAACAPARPPTRRPTVRRAPQANTIFYDNFDFTKGEWQQVSGIWETRDGFMMQKTDDPRQLNAIRYIQSPRISDATIETQLRVKPSRPMTLTNSPQDQELLRSIRYIIGAGIVFRMTDPSNYYMFRLAGEEGAVLGRMRDGAWNEQDLCNPRVRDFLTGSRLGFRPDNWYRLKVDCYANRITVYINDEPVCSVTDDTYAVGQVGLVTFKTAADFDHIKIYDKYR